MSRRPRSLHCRDRRSGAFNYPSGWSCHSLGWWLWRRPMPSSGLTSPTEEGRLSHGSFWRRARPVTLQGPITDVELVGWGQTAFGRLNNLDSASLVDSAAQAALDRAHMRATDIDEVVIACGSHSCASLDLPGMDVASAPKFGGKTRVDVEAVPGSGDEATRTV